MRLFILGASGGTGRQLTDQVLESGDEATAFVRSPDKLGAVRERLFVCRGDPRNSAELAGALRGHDAVLSALGPPGLGPTTILRDCARSTVTAMQTTGIRRMLVISAAVLFDDAGLVAALLRRTLLKNVAADSAEMEQVIMASGLDWTIVRPPRLTNGPLTEHYLVADSRMPRGRRRVSRADVAHFLLGELRQPARVHRIVGMAR